MLAILDGFRAQGLDPRATSLKCRHLRRRTLDQRHAHAEIEDAFDMHAVDIYGLSEIMGPGVGVRVRGNQRRPACLGRPFLPGESLTRRPAQVLPDGEIGELVFTSLSKEAMPVIRYRTRDLTRLLPGTARTMRRMEKVTGRSDDMMIVRGVNVFPTQVEELVLARDTLSGHYQIVLTREGRMDEMTVHVEARPDWWLAPDHARAEGAAELARNIKERIGVSARVLVQAPGGIERSMGKARRVLDQRPKA